MTFPGLSYLRRSSYVTICSNEFNDYTIPNDALFRNDLDVSSFASGCLGQSCRASGT